LVFISSCNLVDSTTGHRGVTFKKGLSWARKKEGSPLQRKRFKSSRRGRGCALRRRTLIEKVWKESVKWCGKIEFWRVEHWEEAVERLSGVFERDRRQRPTAPGNGHRGRVDGSDSEDWLKTWRVKREPSASSTWRGGESRDAETLGGPFCCVGGLNLFARQPPAVDCHFPSSQTPR